ncbi:MAG: hypothetical protein K9G39_05695 [Chlorobium sp.]|uniref:hypothetical protein n=1 Tax=Chlorobium sp. TaxID=1095 RepID=UPI0025BA89E1|nr:hypothetical protein [Chlorobium sp.]MCF8383075.1 hypothetical protein [Chlorobium sp.]
MKQNRHIIKTDWNQAPRLISYWALSLLVLAAGSLMPFTPGGLGILFIDPIIHIALYAILSFVPMVLLDNRKAAFLVSSAIMPLGYLLETLHMIVSDNGFNALYALFNNIGVLLGMATGFIMRLKHHYNEQYEESSKTNISQSERTP